MSALVRVESPGGVVWYDGPHVVRIDSWRCRLLAARRRVPKPAVARYYQRWAWHVCLPEQRSLLGDDASWIEVMW